MRRRSVLVFVPVLALASASTFACGLVLVGSAEPSETSIDAASLDGLPIDDAAPSDALDLGDAGTDADASPCPACPSGFACVSGICADGARGRFTLAANPSGNWTYGWRAATATGTAIGVYARVFTDTQNGGIECWSRDDAGVPPAVFRNPSASVVHPYGTFTMAPGEMAFHPGALGENSVVRWTAPARGSYRATVAVRGLSGYGGSPPTTTGVTVLKGATVVGSTELATLDGGAAIDLPGSVFAAGDTVDVRVDVGTDQNYGYDSTGVDITVFAL